MPKTVDFASMTLDEIIAWKVAKKEEIRVLQAEYDSCNDIYAEKVLQFHVDEATKQLTRASEAAGVSIEDQARNWANEGDDGQKKQANLFIAKVGN